MKGVAARALVALALGAALGCATYSRGRIGAVSTEELPLHMTVVSLDVTGRACGDVFQERFGPALRDALAKAPGATALVNVSYRFERLCMVMRGTAVRVEP